MSDLTQVTVRAEGRWRPRFALAALVRLIAYGLPVVSGSAAAWFVSRELGSTHRVPATAVVLGAAVTVSLLVSRLTMKLMPLAILLRMTMIFPDRAPSRVKVARLASSAHDIGRRLHSRSADESEAAMTMLSLVTALGRHDRRTRGHSERVRLLCDLLADELKLDEDDAGRLRWAALIHDVGKLEIPESILNKPAELTEEEWVVVRRHPVDGARLARPLERWLGPWFAGIAHHHEHWDGSGYPMGLDGEKISLAGRVIAVVDAFETMTSARAYKSAMSTMSARTELALCAGTHFDPAMVRAFLGISLPKLLWSVGPLAFLVNVPYLRWAVESGVRTAEVAATATAATANAAGATVLAVSVGALPSSAASAVPTISVGSHAAASHVSTTATSSGRTSGTTPGGAATSAPMGVLALPGDEGPDEAGLVALAGDTLVTVPPSSGASSLARDGLGSPDEPGQTTGNERGRTPATPPRQASTSAPGSASGQGGSGSVGSGSVASSSVGSSHGVSGTRPSTVTATGVSGRRMSGRCVSGDDPGKGASGTGSSTSSGNGVPGQVWPGDER